jgi:hypothetical protein
MAPSRAVVFGVVATVLVLALSGYVFMQYADPMLLILGLLLVVILWAALLMIHLYRKGIPVRLVMEPAQPPRDDEPGAPRP